MKIIETERLILRTWEEKDVDEYYGINRDPKVIEFLPGSLTIQEVKDFIAAMNQQFHEIGYTLFAAEEKASGHLIGFIGLNPPKWQAHFTPCVEIGWRLGSPYWNQGYATEGAKAVLDYGFNQCGLDEIVSFTVSANVRSIRVMEKLGMIRDINGDFTHPRLPLEHHLSKHVLYRISKPCKISFRLLSFSDIPLMHEWFNLPHVQKFYSLRQWTENQVLEKLKPYITGDKPVLGFIILMNEKPIGYVQQYKISDFPWPNQNLSQAIVNNAAGMDLFIGDQKLIGKRIGSQVIKEFIESKIWPQFQYCIVDPDIKNITAIKRYEKLNFHTHAVIDTEDALGQPVKLNLMMLKR